MKIDAISIFPEYFAPLQLSLLGKAQDGGLLSINVHDLRSQTSDTHHTVDDTPYGGGAGMVMLADVWGKAVDSVIDDGAVLIVLTPAGRRFNQEMAEELSRASHLIFACGRYEGIDDRVRIHYSQPEYQQRNIQVREVSIGDYVLGGGEVASMVMIEAITRLIPGVLGNPLSLAEESHNEEGYLEYPNFTRPQEWRGLEVPPILLSGNHGAIAAWRASQAQERKNTNSN
ncbi:MAG: tRNA (guanosine(37)-N1)-methyltransferase TrmD [Actinobacteria bacterium]|jgi:tRNA (guanine37-N1)-methyltransferase|uniref:tRNA (guanine-N(1)-)-methyltransferase n=1 Tax=freshwater metagenome TaxID=449393 RepID=A0A6J6J9H6_9ZZZZ|nr:tRNA (guanosine(37)-N1)-methyltransferase TrmD [Actinomycetota bacterium]MTA38566.1 tRNA (guanosine(37)-N1)-methyltransferase TrmD [Actinomycetota bacterium]